MLLGVDPEQAPDPPGPAYAASGIYRLNVAGFLFQPIGVTADNIADTVIADDKGNSKISAEDFAVALVNELETPKYHRSQMTIGY